MAKIIVVVDTHCLENGSFVWTGDRPTAYEGCSLLEVCIWTFARCTCSRGNRFSETVSRARYSNTYRTPRALQDTPTKAWSSIWLVDRQLRRKLLDWLCSTGKNPLVAPSKVDSQAPRHCADAVLSLANNATVVSQVSATLVQFCTRWAQSPSGYDFLVASTMEADWLRSHKPVLSTRAHGHQLYTKFDFGEPNGQVVRCLLMCQAGIKSKAGNATTKITCLGCRSTCLVPKVTTERNTPLSRRAMVKVLYPQPQYPTEWKLPDPSTLFMSQAHLSIPTTEPSTSAATPIDQRPSGPTPLLRTSSLPVPSGPMRGRFPSYTGLVIRIPARPLVHSRSASQLENGNKRATALDSPPSSQKKQPKKN